MAKKCKDTDISRILLIIALTGNLPMLSSYEIASSPEDFDWRREFKVAIVDLNEESRKANLFAETVAINRGYQIKVFDNEKEAEEWLLKS